MALLIVPIVISGLVILGLYRQNIITVKGKAHYYVNHTEKLQMVNGKTYLTKVKTGSKLTGLQTLGKHTYYFNPKTGAMEHGFFKIDGNYYYFDKNGQDSVLKAYEHVASNLKTNNTVIEAVVERGLALVGKSGYYYGAGRTAATIAKHHFDCSSFVAWLYRKAGKPLVYQEAASTTILAETGTEVGWNEKQRGDLLVTPEYYSGDYLHVAIYLGNGFILHDASPTGGVAVSRLNQVVDSKKSKTFTWVDLFKPGYVRREV